MMATVQFTLGANANLPADFEIVSKRLQLVRAVFGGLVLQIRRAIWAVG